jgi:hypothetical protein
VEKTGAAAREIGGSRDSRDDSRVVDIPYAASSGTDEGGYRIINNYGCKRGKK